MVIDSVNNALGAFVRRHFPWTHQSILPREACAKAAATYRQIASESDLARILAPTVEIPDSALADLAGEMLATIAGTAALLPSPLASTREHTSAPDPGVPKRKRGKRLDSPGTKAAKARKKVEAVVKVEKA